MRSRVWPLDDNGLVQIPLRFYWLLLLLLRPYLCWILILTVPTPQQDLLRLFYPERQEFMLACLIALPLLLLIVALSQRKPKGYRPWKVLWRQGRLLLLVTAIMDLILTTQALPEQVMLDAPWKVITPFLLVMSVIWLLKSQTLKMVFSEWPDKQ